MERGVKRRQRVKVLDFLVSLECKINIKNHSIVVRARNSNKNRSIFNSLNKIDEFYVVLNIIISKQFKMNLR